ncbi:hypothetical protein A5761_00020 [Mycolicibacterium setense]|uniref:DUF1254 domain-containing protein n=1 Tax=Mycolicibacterium setense TaxID=431269 RepID=UPI0007EC2CDE|nr:DUF1254 domain-containing protein [Mycolicibacterium setense]OBB19581.1 hypothetical protein A5761_00020 [Mycolicibacterium setense]
MPFRRLFTVSIVWFFTVVLALSACGTKESGTSEGGSPPAGATSADAAGLREKAKDAYIFAYGLVMNYRTMYRQAIEGDHAFGKWLHLGTSSPEDTDIVTPNNDTPYSYAWVDVRTEPWVLTLPPIEPDRYYTSQWDDLWAYVLDNPGSVNDGNKGITVMLADPEWNGEVPPGVSRVIKGDSEFLGTLTRTQLMGTDNGLDQVKAIQAHYKLQPLSAFLNQPAPAAAPAVDWPAWTEGDETTPKFWDYVSFLLPFTSNNPQDQKMLDNLAALGVKRGEPFKQDELSQEVKDALKGGIEDGRAELKKLSEATDIDTAKMFGDRAKMGTDHTQRALGVYMGIFGNVSQQAMYYTLPSDTSGAPLDGSKGSYAVTFPAGQIPPVNYFWSFTMYSVPDRFLVANPVNRYSIGSSTPGLKQNPDGSLTVYFSAKDPGGDKSSNWLPAPEGPFWVVLRTYGPKPPILDKSWHPPTAEKQA